MINTLYTINPVDSEHLREVIALMRVKGRPTIRIVDCGDYYQALEGSHRIASAEVLGLPVDWEILAQDELVNSDTLDLDGLAPGEWYMAGEIAGELHHPGLGVYTINQDDTVTCKIPARY